MVSDSVRPEAPESGTKPSPGPGLAVSYLAGEPGFLERVLPLVDYIEVTPDALAAGSGQERHLDRGALAALRSIGDDARIIAHGVGLSIGSADDWCEEYLDLLDELVESVDVAWHSEHLGYLRVNGEFLGTMLPVPPTDDALDLVCSRVDELQHRYGLPFLLENVVALLPQRDHQYSSAGFMNEIAARTRSGILLDVYNLECDVHNRGVDLERFLAELELDRVRELHVAGGVVHEGFQLDIHSRTVADGTIGLTRETLARAQSVGAVTFELLDEAAPVLGADAICTELARLRSELALV